MDSEGDSTCDNDVSTCDYSDGFQVVEELAANNTLFVEEFLRVFTKMIEKVLYDINGKEGMCGHF